MSEKNKEQELFNTSQLNKKWQNLMIKSLHRVVDDKFIVFTNDMNEFDWIYNSDTSNPNYSEMKETQLISEITCLKTKDLNICEWSIQQQFRELLGEAFSNIYSCKYENAETVLKKADCYISKRNFDITRTWTMLSSLITMIVITLIAFIVLCKIKPTGIFQVLNYSLFGVIGVFVASFMNLNKQYMLIEIGKYRICSEVIAHSFVGICLAFVGLLCIKNNILLPTLNDLPCEHSEILIAICISCCEGFFPRLISKFDSQIGGKSDAK